MVDSAEAKHGECQMFVNPSWMDAFTLSIPKILSLKSWLFHLHALIQNFFSRGGGGEREFCLPMGGGRRYIFGSYM